MFLDDTNFKNQDIYSIGELLIDFELCGPISTYGSYRTKGWNWAWFKIVLRMSTEDFKNMICLIDPEATKIHHDFRIYKCNRKINNNLISCKRRFQPQHNVSLKSSNLDNIFNCIWGMLRFNHQFCLGVSHFLIRVWINVVCGRGVDLSINVCWRWI